MPPWWGWEHCHHGGGSGQRLTQEGNPGPGRSQPRVRHSERQRGGGGHGPPADCATVKNELVSGGGGAVLAWRGQTLDIGHWSWEEVGVKQAPTPPLTGVFRRFRHPEVRYSPLVQQWGLWGSLRRLRNAFPASQSAQRCDGSGTQCRQDAPRGRCAQGRTPRRRLNGSCNQLGWQRSLQKRKRRRSKKGISQVLFGCSCWECALNLDSLVGWVPARSLNRRGENF